MSFENCEIMTLLKFVFMLVGDVVTNVAVVTNVVGQCRFSRYIYTSMILQPDISLVIKTLYG